MKRIVYILIGIVILSAAKVFAQQPLRLNLQRTIALANDSSLEAFRTANMYLSGYWEYRTFKANRLPSMSLNMTPIRYYRDFTQRYDSESNTDVYRSQRSLYSYGNLSIEQNFDLTGGTFFIDTELGYLRNFSENITTQYSSVPIRLGYSQSLLGYNAFKWDRKIEPLKYEKVRKEFVYNSENIAEQATTYFFALATAQAEFKIAKDAVASSDTLYKIGMRRHQIAAISKSDLLTLRLDYINATNSLKNAEIDLKKAMSTLLSFLNMDKHTIIEVELPARPRDMMVSVDEALVHARTNNPQFLGLQQDILEAEKTVDKTKKESRFNASISASVGYNQSADAFRDSYRSPLRQELVSVSLTIPLIDWGVRKGKNNMARNNLNVVKIASKQSEISIEEEVNMAVNDFNIQQGLIVSAEEALDLAISAYNETQQRFIIGKETLSSLTLSLNRQQEAQRNYVTALQNYWLNYYKIRKLTLHDFSTGLSLTEKFDYEISGKVSYK